MRAKRGSQAGLGTLISRVMKKAGLDQRFRQAQVMLYWKDIVGPANARHSWPLRLRDGVLIVGCSSAGWAQTLTMMKEQIMEKIAGRFGECPLKDLQFRGVGQPAEKAEDEPKVMLPAKIALAVEDVQWIRHLTDGISDERLRQKAEAALGSLLRQRKWHECHGNHRCTGCGRMHRAQTALCLSCRKAKS